MKSIIKWWGNNPVAANLLMIGIWLAGVLGFTSLERELFPTIPVSGLEISVAWPGASPQDVEEQIVARIEESLKDLEDVDWIRSTSNEGNASVRINAESSTDFSRIKDEIKTRIDSISTFPTDVELPRIVQWNSRNEMIRVALHGEIGEAALKNLAEDLRREVAALKGVSIVELFGTRDEEVSIEVSETALRRYQLTFDDIVTAMKTSSINMSAGTLRTEAGSFSLRVRNLADSKRAFESIVVRQNEKGGVIRVSDVANVIDGFVDKEILATLNGEPAVLIQVMSAETMDIVTMSNSIKKWIEERRATLPKGAQLTLWTDGAKDFNSRLSTIGYAAMSGLVLVFLILFLTLRPKIAFWVAMGIATAYAGAFVFLSAVDTSINMLSTFAFLLVLGVVVDDAIIIGESVHSQNERGNTGTAAAVRGAQLVSKPVIFGVLTTIIVFLPWLFISGTAQEFTRQIAWVVILALSFSLIEALLILPAHLRHLKQVDKSHRIYAMQQRVANSIVHFGRNRYGPMLKRSIARPWLTLSIFIAMLMIGLGGVLGAGYVKTKFEPDIEAEQIYINIDLREGTTYRRALEILQQMQVAQEELVAEVEKDAEGKKNKIVENWYTRSRRDSVIAIVKLASPEVRSMSAKAAAVRLRELIGDVPEAKSVQVRYSLTSNSPDLEFSIRHADLEVLRLASDELKARLQEFPALYDVEDDIETISEEIRFRLKPGAEKMGITLGTVIKQVRHAYYGDEVQRLPRDGKDVKVMVRYPQADRRSIESLKHFRLRTDDGREIPLTAVAELYFERGLKQIEHWDRKRATEVSAYLKEPIREEILDELNENFFPKWEKKYVGIERGNIGQSAGEEKFMKELANLLAIAFFAMYCMLAVAFKSYSQPVLILIVIPFALLGAVIGHLVMGMSFSIYSYFGIVAAAGVLLNDNLVLIDYYNRLREKGFSVIDAIQEACEARFRPILITSVTTFVGLVPLMLERSSQAAWLQPIVVSLAYGLVIAFFVTMFLVPAMLIIGARIRHRKQKEILVGEAVAAADSV